MTLLSPSSRPPLSLLCQLYECHRSALHSVGLLSSTDRVESLPDNIRAMVERFDSSSEVPLPDTH